MVDWDLRFAGESYLYGEAPNEFLASVAGRLQPGMCALVPADGEGRNGVWLAEQGLLVHTVDGSSVGIAKALRLAARHGVSLKAECADLTTWQWPRESYDVLASIYFHLPSSVRSAVHAQMLAALRPGGLLVLEAFHPMQLQYHSGGPKDADMLYTEEALAADFAGAKVELLERRVITLDESDKHRGEACVVRLIATRAMDA